MSTVVRVTHEIRGVRRTNRVRVDASDPAAAADEMCGNLGEQFGVDPKEVKIISVDGDPASRAPEIKKDAPKDSSGTEEKPPEQQIPQSAPPKAKK